MLRLGLVCLCLCLAVCAARGASPWRLDHLLTTFWCPPPATDEALAAVAAEHYTMTWVPESGLDLAAKHGLRAMLQDGLISPASLDDPGKRAQLDALIERVKDHPALYAYYILDEPSAAQFPALGRLVAYLREKDPAHLAYINLFPTYASNEQLGTKGDVVTAYREHLRQFVEVVKPGLISWDHYQFFKDHDTDQYFLNLKLIRDAAQQAGVPFLNIVQSSVVVKAWRKPNADELRYLVYTTLAYGGRGLSYFTYWGPQEYDGLYVDGKATPLAAAAARLNAEMASLSPVLMALDSRGVYHTAPIPWGGEAIPARSPIKISGGEFVLGLFDHDAFMVVNRDYRKQATAHLTLAPGSKVQEFDRRTGKWRGYTTTTDGRVSVRLRPGDGRLFRIVKG